MVTRRKFLATAGAVSGSYVFHSHGLAPYAVSGFSGTAPERTMGQQTAQAASMKFGYAAITWGSELAQAMDDIAAVGFRGIQLRGEAFAQFGDRRAALREALERHRLTF